jgi:hypothetical protein
MTDYNSIYELLYHNIIATLKRENDIIIDFPDLHEYEYTNYNETCKISFEVVDIIYNSNNIDEILDIQIDLDITMVIEGDIIDDIGLYMISEIMIHNKPELIQKMYYIEIAKSLTSNHTEEDVQNTKKIYKFDKDDKLKDFKLEITRDHIIYISKLGNHKYKYHTKINNILFENIKDTLEKIILEKFARNAALPVDSRFIATCYRLLARNTQLLDDLNDIILGYMFDNHFQN